MIMRKVLDFVTEPNKIVILNRNIHLSLNRIFGSKNELNNENKIVLKPNFDHVKNKTKDCYLDTIKIFINRDVHRRGHVDFIYSALKNMEKYGVHKDIDVYKALIDVLPKAKFIPQNFIQSEFMHYPKQQQCAVDLLEQMEDNGVMPDSEIGEMLLNIFGKRGHPLRKYWRMMYWMPKFKHLSPWPVPNPPPNDSFELAQMAISRATSVDIQSKIAVYHTTEISGSIENTWIVSGQSPIQRKLLENHKDNKPLYVEGPHRIWLRSNSVNYFVLQATTKSISKEEKDPDDVSKIEVSLHKFPLVRNTDLANEISVHEQDDGLILAVCATGTSSKDSLLSWIRCLEKDGNSILANIPIVFTLKSAAKEISFSKAEIGDK